METQLEMYYILLPRIQIHHLTQFHHFLKPHPTPGGAKGREHPAELLRDAAMRKGLASFWSGAEHVVK